MRSTEAIALTELPTRQMGGPVDSDLADDFKKGVVKALGPAGPPLLPLLVPVFVEVVSRVGSCGEPVELISVEEAARRLGIGRTKTFALIEEGRLGSVKLGKRRLVPPEAVVAFKAELVGSSGQGRRPA